MAGKESKTAADVVRRIRQESFEALDLKALTVVRAYPVRIKCALLPWTALEVGLERHRASRAPDQ